MVKKRLIYTLLYSDGHFMLSRNFRLQKVGDIHWLRKNYDFQEIARHIDELIVLNVARGEKQRDQFCTAVKELVSFCFIPVAVGGGINQLDTAKRLFDSGADKLVVNSALFQARRCVQELIQCYGAQSLVASLDCKREESGYRIYTNNGQQPLELGFAEVLADVADQGVGEIYLNSMDQDGTGQGYDLELLEHVNEHIGERRIPLIMAGGAGNGSHFIKAITQPNVDAVATANIFNFIGDALPQARQQLLQAEVPLAVW